LIDCGDNPGTVRQYRHNLRSYQLDFPAGTVHETEEPETAARRELEEETGFTVAAPATAMRPLDLISRCQRRNFSLSETNKYTHVFLASPVAQSGPARGDTEIEKDFDMSVVLIPVEDALSGVGTTTSSMEIVGALMAASSVLL